MGPLSCTLLATRMQIPATRQVGHLNDPVALSGVVLASSVYNVSGGRKGGGAQL